MTCVRDVRTAEEVDREAERIKRFIESEKEPVRIEWGTIEVMERVGSSPINSERNERRMTLPVNLAGLLLELSRELSKEDNLTSLTLILRAVGGHGTDEAEIIIHPTEFEIINRWIPHAKPKVAPSVPTLYGTTAPPEKSQEEREHARGAMERQARCWECKNKEGVPGDCHIHCLKPPTREINVLPGGDERYAYAADKVREMGDVVVRCVWQGSGCFPFMFDGNTVFGCSNFEKVVVAV